MIIPNALINVYHIDGTVDVNVQVSIQPAPYEKILASGASICYDIHIPPRILMTQGDELLITKMYGHPNPGQVNRVTAKNPVRIGGLLPYTNVEVIGVYL